MIKDNIKNAKLYESINPLFKKAFEFLNSLTEIKSEKVFIDGENLYAIITGDTVLKDIDQNKWENHKNYIDIQYIFKGKEKFGVCDVKILKKINGYDDVKDIEFFQGNDDLDLLTLNEKEFIIVFPDDAHLPARKISGCEKADRIVLKVKI